jgi:hypothetical protein
MKSMGECVSVSHRPHDIRCVKNKSTCGLSARTVCVDKHALNMTKINTMPLSKGHTKGLPSVARHFGQIISSTATRTTNSNGTTTTTTGSKEKEGDKDKDAIFFLADETLADEISADEDVLMEIEHNGDDDENRRTKMAADPRAELDHRMASINQSPVSEANAPAGMSHMVHCMMKKFRHRKPKGGAEKTAAYSESQQEHRQHFPKSHIKFTFPSEAWTTLPSPHCHALQNTSWIHVDWEVSHPGIALCCFECKKEAPNNEPSTLVHDRTNFAKNRTLFPMFDQGGSVIWASVMSCCCPKCRARHAGNDGRLLQMLDPHVRSACPAQPSRHATEAAAAFHLTKELADDLDHDMLTHGNADDFSSQIYSRKFREQKDRLATCFSCEENFKHEHCIPIGDWIGEFPPDGKALRALHERAERLSLTPAGISNYHRHKLEIQSVGCSKVFLSTGPC